MRPRGTAILLAYLDKLYTTILTRTLSVVTCSTREQLSFRPTEKRLAPVYTHTSLLPLARRNNNTPRTRYQTMTKNTMTGHPIANPDLPASPKGKYPAKDHCRRVAKWISENGGPSSGVIYLEGMATHLKEVRIDRVSVASRVHAD